MKIIDSHVHFWDPHHLRYKWLDDLPTINKPYMPADLPAAGDGWQMDGLVFVQADCSPEQAIDEVAWVNRLNDPRIQAIVAYAPLEQENFRETLDKLKQYPNVKGIRRLIQSEGDGFATQQRFVDAVRVLPEYGYSFDICVLQHQLPDALQLVEWAPDVQFVVDHVGKPDISTGEIERWKLNMTRMAAFDNASVKLSGMVTEADLDNWKPEHLQPYIDHVLAAFGPGRVMFGGDFPVLELAHTDYEGWVKTAFNATASLSEADKQRVFYDNAKAFYRLP